MYFTSLISFAAVLSVTALAADEWPSRPISISDPTETNRLVQIGRDCGKGLACLVDALKKEAETARPKYEKTLAELHPITRKTLSAICGPIAGDHVLKRTDCYLQQLPMLKGDALYFLDQLKAADGRPARTARELYRELGEQERANTGHENFLVGLIRSNCGRDPGDACMKETAEAVRTHLTSAQAHLSTFRERLAGWSLLAYECGRAVSPEACRKSADWPALLFPDSGSVAFAPGAPVEFRPVPPARTTGKGKSTRPGNGARGDAEADALLACVIGYQAKPANERSMNSDAVCNRLQGSDLAPFSDEVIQIFGLSSMYSYFDLLRMEAIGRYLRAHREILGHDLSEIPNNCSRYAPGIRRYGSVEKNATPHARYVLATDPQYLDIIRHAASDVQELSLEAHELIHTPMEKCEVDPGQHVPVCKPNPDFGVAQSRLDDIRNELMRYFSMYPILAAGHDIKREPFHDLTSPQRLAASRTDEELKKTLAELAPLLSQDIRTNIERMCGEGEDGFRWPDLLLSPEITKSVLERFPQFEFVQKCAVDKLKEYKRSKAIVLVAWQVGCVAGSILTDFALAPFCGATLTYQSYRDFNEAAARRTIVSQCRAAGSAVCSGQEYLAARMAYNEAVWSLGFSAALNAIELPLANNALRAIGKYLTSPEMKQLTSLMRSARTRADVENVLNTARRMVPSKGRALLEFELPAARTASTTGAATESSALVTPLLDETPKNLVSRAHEIIGRKLSDAEKSALGRALRERSAETHTPLSLARENRILSEAGFHESDIAAFRRARYLPNSVGVPAAPIPVNAHLVEATLRPLDNGAIRAVRGGKRLRYVVDSENQIHLIDTPLVTRPDSLTVLRTKTGNLLVKESGEIEMEGTRGFRLKPDYGLDVSAAEVEEMIANASQRTGLAITRRANPRALESRALDCMDILAGQLSGGSFILDTFLASNAINLGSILITEPFAHRIWTKDGKPNKDGRQVIVADTFGNNVGAAMHGLTGKRLVVGDSGWARALDARLANGFRNTATQKRLYDIFVMKDAKKRSESLTTFNQAHFLARIPLNQWVDSTMIKTLPNYLFDACRSGSKLRVFVSPRAIRIYERGASSLIYWGTRKAVVGE